MQDQELSQTIKYSFLKILTSSDLSSRRLPLMEIKSSNPGPVVWLTGCVHGDELGGVVVIQEIFKKLRKDRLLKGSIHAFPLMNPIGLETGSRQITISKEDLNRSFPGNKNGSLAERIAAKILATITETEPTLVLDLHNDWRQSIPYALIDPAEIIKSQEMYEKVITFSKITGFLIINDQKETYKPGHIERTLTISLIKHGIPSLSLELGESYVVNEKNVEYGVRSILNILAYLGMIRPLNEFFAYPLSESVRGKILDYSNQPASSTSGITRFLVKPGELVRKGQPVAKIYNAFGKLRETLRALQDTIILGYSDSSVAFPGTPVMAFGIIKGQSAN
jgi:predicted deacylase